MTALNNLLFRVSLLDAMSGPARSMMSTMDRVTTGIQSGFNKIGYGAAGLVGAAYTLDSILQPAKEMNAALGTVSSLGVGAAVLNDLNKAALKFSVQYGESAAEFVSSSYDIQSAISGLSGNELSTFTNASAILAKGTKADMGTITDYVGTMYGIFQKNADAMGKADWINQMAGQTAVAVNIFKTTGKGMSDAFGSIGASGQTMGVAMNEQMAILGTLQATMSGSEAGTKYRAFLDGVGNAQDKLGLKFTDSQGKMLPMVDILEKIKGKYGDIDTVAKSDLFKKAFGTQEATALVKLLSSNIDGLSGSIAKVGEQTGLQGAIDMANAMTQPWDRAGKAVDALRIMLGQRLLVVMAPIYNGIAAISEKLMRWSSLFPNISNYIGYAVLGIIGITAALSALSIVVGLGMVVMSGFGLVMALITSPITLAVIAIGAIGYAIYRLLDIWSQWTYGMSIFDTMAAGYQAAKLGTVALIEAVVGLFDTMANGYQAAVQGVSDFIAKTMGAFDGLKTWLSHFNLWETLLNGADALIGLLNKIPGINIDLGGAAAQLSAPDIGGPKTASPTLSTLATQPQWLQQPAPGLLSDGFAPRQPAAMTQPPAAIAQPPALASLVAPAAIAQPALANLVAPAAITQPLALANLVTPTAMTQPSALASLATKLPFISAQSATPAMIAQPIAPPPSLSKSQSASVPKGGIISQITNANNSKSINVGGITINNPAKPVTGQFLADELHMAAG